MKIKSLSENEVSWFTSPGFKWLLLLPVISVVLYHQFCFLIIFLFPFYFTNGFVYIIPIKSKTYLSYSFSHGLPVFGILLKSFLNTSIVTCIKTSLQSRQYTHCFIDVNSFHPHNYPMSQILFFFSILQVEKMRSYEVQYLTQVTQLGSDRDSTEMRKSGSTVQKFNQQTNLLLYYNRVKNRKVFIPFISF